MISKDKLKLIRSDLDAALAVITRKHKLAELVTGKITFDRGGAFTVKIEGVEEGGLTKEAQLYQQLRNIYGNLPEFGATIAIGKRLFKITGSNTTGSKIIAERLDGAGSFLLPIAEVLKAAHFVRVSAHIEVDAIKNAGGSPQ